MNVCCLHYLWSRARALLSVWSWGRACKELEMWRKLLDMCERLEKKNNMEKQEKNDWKVELWLFYLSIRFWRLVVFVFLQNIDLCLIMWSFGLEFRKNQVRIFQFMESFLHGFCHRLLLNLSKYLVLFYLNFYKPFDISHDAVFPLITEGHRGQGDASIHHFCAMNIMSFKLSEFSAFISKRQGFCFRSSG